MTKIKDIETVVTSINTIIGFIDNQKINGVNYKSNAKFSKICNEIKAEILEEFSKNGQQKTTQTDMFKGGN